MKQKTMKEKSNEKDDNEITISIRQRRTIKKTRKQGRTTNKTRIICY